MSEEKEIYEFQTEAAQILELMTHSVYKNRDTFLRELISNASDAIDRRKFLGLTDQALLDAAGDYHVYLSVDSEARTLTVWDNGVGMGRQEVIDNIGTIARSGTKEFAQALAAAQESGAPDLIGQFGIGFYASFMVADRVVVDTLRAGETEAVRWESGGDGRYSLGVGERREAGTTVTLQLKAADDEAGIRDYTAESVLRDIVRRYSDFVAYPIRTQTQRQEPILDADGKPVEGGKTQTISEVATLNSMQALWTRPASEVEDSEYEEFYHHIAHDWQAPLRRIPIKAEGTFEYRALLFIPSKAPFDLFWQGANHGLKLYVRRVLIMDDCRDLLPEYLRFVRGVVDAEDLPLNVSREVLQEDRQIKVIKRHLVKKVLESLAALKKDDPDTYGTFYAELGRVLKEGLYSDASHKDALLDLILCSSSREDTALTSLADYVERMKERDDGQKAIYYLTGGSLQTVRTSPHLEAFVDKGYEVLFFTDPVDEIWLQQGGNYGDYALTSIGKGTVELGSNDEKKAVEADLESRAEAHKNLLTKLRSVLQDDVKEVRLSQRMTSSAVCLVGETNDLTPQLEEMLKSMGQEPPANKRILEINPKHPVLEGLQHAFDSDPGSAIIEKYARLLYGQAVLAEGGQLPAPGEFAKLVSEVMADALQPDAAVGSSNA